jgi:hypothetical protein
MGRTRTNPLVFVCAIALLGAATLLALNCMSTLSNASLGTLSQQQVAELSIEGQTEIEDDLDIHPHAAKHKGEALWALSIYNMLRTGGCAASRKMCQNDGREIYLCQDPTTQMIGMLVVIPEKAMILTGYAPRDGYLYKQMKRWRQCD